MSSEVKLSKIPVSDTTWIRARADVAGVDVVVAFCVVVFTALPFVAFTVVVPSFAVLVEVLALADFAVAIPFFAFFVAFFTVLGFVFAALVAFLVMAKCAVTQL